MLETDLPTNKDDHDLIELIRQNVRSFQGYWAWKDKPVAESSSARDVLGAMGLDVTEVHLGDDPPDCWFKSQGKRVSVEQTELVSEEALHTSLRSGQHHYRLWNENDFLDEISNRISKKSSNLSRYQSEFDENWLLIVTDEFELSAIRVEGWLKSGLDHCGFDRVLLALSYHPSENGGFIPVFDI